MSFPRGGEALEQFRRRVRDVHRTERANRSFDEIVVALGMILGPVFRPVLRPVFPAIFRSVVWRVHRHRLVS